jgi:hypothetical protein
VKNGAKPAAAHVTLANFKNYQIIKQFLEKEGLYVAHSKFRIIQSQNDKCAQFDDPRSTPFDTFYVFIARTQQKIQRMIKTWQKYPAIQKKQGRQHLKLNQECAELLGFPNCCLKEYNLVQSRSGPHPDRLHAENTMENSVLPYSYYLNNFHWDTPYYLISHFPCNYHCKSSISYAKRVLNTIYEEDNSYGHMLEQFLKKPMLYLDFHRHFTFDGNISGNRIVYRMVYTQNYESVEQIRQSAYCNKQAYITHKNMAKKLQSSKSIDVKDEKILTFR